MKCLKSTLLSFSVIFFFSASAQLRLPVTNAFRADMQKIVEAYPAGFTTMRGEVIEQNPQSIEYASLVKPNGAKESSIIKYSSTVKDIFSWQALMLTTEDYNEAVKKYKWLFTQLKGMSVKYVADQYTLQGSYETPAESRKFTTSTLSVFSPPSPLKKMKVEVSMQFEFPEWKVLVLVYEKEREDDEKGDAD